MLMHAKDTLAYAAERAKQSIKFLWARYKTAPFLAKILLWGILVFDLAILALLVAIGPSKVTQTFYDFAQKLASFRLGWLILGTVLGERSGDTDTRNLPYLTELY